jgi:cell division protein FtsN
VPTPAPAARKSSKPATATVPSTDTVNEAVGNFDFYNRLPNYEVVLPERDKEVRRQQPTTKITEAGTYVLQVGSYRDEADALLHRDRYVKQGYPAAVQRVSVDAEVWHRVRIGPITDLNRHALREQLYRANVTAMVVRVID